MDGGMGEWIASTTGSECGRKQEAGVPTSCMPQLNLSAAVWPSLTSSPQHLMNVLENAEVSALLKARVLHSVVGEEAALRTWRRALAAGIKREECHIYGQNSESRVPLILWARGGASVHHWLCFQRCTMTRGPIPSKKHPTNCPNAMWRAAIWWSPPVTQQ